MTSQPKVLCIGSVLWDMIGHTTEDMAPRADMPGRITRLPGGVAMNIAMALNDLGLSVALLSAIGLDTEGRELQQAAAAMGLNTDYLYHSADLPTDRYMAIEDKGGLVAAIADAHSLEAAGDAILAPLADGRLASATRPWTGTVALDGNLSSQMLKHIAQSDMFDRADLRLAPASPGKARRLDAFLGHRHATLYVNLIEANLLTGRQDQATDIAARALLNHGLRRVLVTNGGEKASEACAGQPVISKTPPAVTVRRITGAGDSFMAAHIAAELEDADPEAAFIAALDAAAAHVAGDPSQ